MEETDQLRERSNRVRGARVPRHRDPQTAGNFTASFSALGKLAYAGAQVSASVHDLRTGEEIVSIDDRVVLPTAGVGKLLLLIEVSARLTSKDVSAYGILDKTPSDAVGVAGLWQHMQAPALPVHDIAAFIGATGDNTATNVLLRQLTLEAVHARAESLGLKRTALLDLVREARGPDDAPQLSVGSTHELAHLMARLARGEVVDQMTSERVMGWLAQGVDLSMVASAFGLDPLDHRNVDHNVLLVNVTGSDRGVRSEVGAFRGPRAAVSYAASVQFEDNSLATRLRVLEAMRALGNDILEYAH